MDAMHLSQLKDLADGAARLARETGSLCTRLDRSDEFDEEQRAEMYAILQAIGREATTEATALEGLIGSEGREVERV